MECWFYAMEALEEQRGSVVVVLVLCNGADYHRTSGASSIIIRNVLRVWHHRRPVEASLKWKPRPDGMNDDGVSDLASSPIGTRERERGWEHQLWSQPPREMLRYSSFVPCGTIPVETSDHRMNGIMDFFCFVSGMFRLPTHNPA
jgi:hypothetical protein